MPRDQTDPNIEPTLSDVKVTEDVCRRRTDKIIAIQTKTFSLVESTGKKLDTHIAIHKAGEKVRANGVTKRNSNARLFGLVFVVAMGIGGLVWTASKLFNQPDVSEIVKAVIAAQKNP